MRRISVIITAWLLALFLVMLVAGGASAKPNGAEGHIVRPGESIQAAVDAAEPGDTNRGPRWRTSRNRGDREGRDLAAGSQGRT